ncbi:hypothetical protein EDB89DRAFT_1947832, partial [Lactarius sanguifluus]
MRPTVLIPDPAASERGLSNSIATCRRPRWPPLRSLASRGSLRDHLQPPDPAGAQCTPLFPSLIAPHSRAALAIRQRLDRHRHGPTYDTSRPARACALTRVASHSQIPCILVFLGHFEHFRQILTLLRLFTIAFLGQLRTFWSHVDPLSKTFACHTCVFHPADGVTTNIFDTPLWCVTTLPVTITSVTVVITTTQGH